MATRSVLFGFIAVLQFVTFILMCLCHMPGFVYFDWKVFVVQEENLAVQLRTMDKDMAYGLWHKCTQDEQDCEMIEDGDVVVSDDTRMNELTFARVALVFAHLLSILAIVSSVANTCKRREIVTSIHLYLAFFQCFFIMASAALATHVMRVGDWVDISLGWVFTVFWFTVCFTILVLLVSFCAPCMYISYTEQSDEDDNYYGNPDKNAYVLSQNF